MFGVTRGEHFSSRSIFEDPLAGPVAPAPEIRRGTDPIVVHVNAERGGRRVLREQTRFARHLRERHALPAELLRDGHLEIPGGFQLVEVVQTKRVVAIAAGRALTAPVKKRLGQYGTGSRSHELSRNNANGGFED